jgi:hypothetical protein
MQYLCLVYLEQDAFEGMSEAEQKALARESLAYDDELRRRGPGLGVNALQPVASATTLRARNGKLSTTDGPFAETKEYLGGYILIEARDLDEAIHIGAEIPMALKGSIEIRPILPLKP